MPPAASPAGEEEGGLRGGGGFLAGDTHPHMRSPTNFEMGGEAPTVGIVLEINQISDVILGFGALRASHLLDEVAGNLRIHEPPHMGSGGHWRGPHSRSHLPITDKGLALYFICL
ncbi:hypothetical protein CRG98_041568 [Punica granatum]|uniref:Uncharacterized protein n=1 Tax=Punica granatum TaxID=22663 RepID=A0A2I0I246_PUNGR|nr:hypothetical protein CRG98_041568 [Punica granatum]